MDLVYAQPNNAPTMSLPEYFKMDLSKLSDREKNSYMDIIGALFVHKVDKETCLAIAKSFEEKYGRGGDDLGTRLDKFKGFLKLFDSKTDLIQSVKNLGMLSKSDLEEYAQETGNWLPSIKRTMQDERKKEENANQANETRPEAVVQ